jgi:hypothetical protein
MLARRFGTEPIATLRPTAVQRPTQRHALAVTETIYVVWEVS